MPKNTNDRLAAIEDTLEVVLDHVAEPVEDSAIRNAVTEYLALTLEGERTIDGMRVRFAGATQECRGPLGGTSGNIAFVVTDKYGFAHAVMVNVYSDSRTENHVRRAFAKVWAKASKRQRRINAEGITASRAALLGAKVMRDPLADFRLHPYGD